MRLIAYLNPLYYVVEAGRALGVGQLGIWPVKLAFIVLVLLCVAVVWWGHGYIVN